MFDRDEVGCVRLEMRRLGQPGEVVAEQPPASMKLSDTSEKSTRKQLRWIAAGHRQKCAMSQYKLNPRSEQQTRPESTDGGKRGTC